MKYVYSVLVLLLALFFAAFIQQNSASIQLKYFFWSGPYLPISLYMILCFALGYGLAVVVGFASGVRFRLRASGAEKEVRQLRSELDKLKNEEIVAVRSEYLAGSQDPAVTAGDRARTPDQETPNISGDDLGSDVKTVITGSGGEEEK